MEFWGKKKEQQRKKSQQQQQQQQQQQNNKMGLRSIMSRRLCFGLLRTSLLFIEIILIFSHSLFFNRS